MFTNARFVIALIAGALPLAASQAQPSPQPYPTQPYGYGYNGPNAGNWFGRLIGSDYNSAQYQLSRSGFRQVDRFNAGRRREGYIWFSDRSGQCLQIIAFRGRVESATNAQSNRCGGYQTLPLRGVGGGTSLLNGLIGKGFNRADERLRQNGFRNVDSFTTSPNSYATIWFDGQQCLQLTTVNGVLSGAADIGRHPRCR